LAQIDRSQRLLEELSELDPKFEAAAARLRESRYLLEEVAHELRDYASTVESDPVRVDRVEERLAEIQAMKRKYGPGLSDVFAFVETARRELEDLESSETALEALDRQQRDLRRQCLELARRLSEGRQRAAKPLQSAVERELGDLEMRRTRFVVGIESRKDALSENGIDQVEFFISANPGEAPRPLARIASGGELSRIMLSLLSLLSMEHDRRTLIFDEIDSGIGGRVASRLGEKLTRLARRHQVFCVTHLPQIAACADHHFRVSKTRSRKRTVVRLKRLEGAERVEEISRMLAGGSVTETTRRHAEELLQAGGL
ncbi:MAG TPA: DNA repair protein RecN, partial [Acidobacteriota bacterium]|nr:DNA repair protein RecN [Acidobacteriota bacterium]